MCGSLRVYRGVFGSSRYDGGTSGWYVLVVLGGFVGFGFCIHFSRCLVPCVLGTNQYIRCGMLVRSSMKKFTIAYFD